MLLLCVLCLSGRAAGEEAILEAIDLDKFVQAGSESGMDVRDMLMGWISGESTLDVDGLRRLGEQAARAAWEDFRRVASALAAPMIVSLLIRLALPGSAHAQRSVRFICRAGMIAALAQTYVRMSAVASGLIEKVLSCSGAMTPALIASVALSGAETTAAALTPMSAVCADLIQNVLRQWGLPLCAASAGIAIAGNLSDHVRLKRLQSLFKQVMQWGTGLIMAGFMGALTIQGRIGAGRDSAAVRTARYAIESIVPVIGGNVSDSLDSLLSTAALVKNALGATGLLLILSVCILPMGRIAGMSLLLKLTSAIAEPLGDDAMTALVGQFAQTMEMLLVVCATAMLLTAMLAGSCMSAAGNVVR